MSKSSNKKRKKNRLDKAEAKKVPINDASKQAAAASETQPEPTKEPNVDPETAPAKDEASENPQAQPETEAGENVSNADAALEDKLEAELADARDQVLRARADFDNYRKRMARQMEQVRKTAAEALIQEILPGIDNLGLALQHADDNPDALKQGVAMVFKQLQGALGSHGLKPIEAEGKPFDPNIHEAVQQVASGDVEKDHVVQVFQPGYMLGDMILRPAKVVVSTGKPQTSADNTKTNTAESSANAE